MVNTDSTAFFVLTGVLVVLALVMPVFNSLLGDDVNVNDPRALVDENEVELNFNTFASSVARTFFWYYGELGLWGNGFKFIINLTWLYLFIRLIRGGG